MIQLVIFVILGAAVLALALDREAARRQRRRARTVTVTLTLDATRFTEAVNEAARAATALAEQLHPPTNGEDDE